MEPQSTPHTGAGTRRLGISGIATMAAALAAAVLFGAALVAPQLKTTEREARDTATTGGTLQGACCFGVDCAGGTDQRTCEAQGGQWFEGRDCANFVCPQACCFSTDQCIDEFPEACLARGGFPQGPVTCDNVFCQIPEEPCCLPNGACDFLLGTRCREAGGVPLGVNADCLGDANGNNVDDACDPNGPCDDCGPFPHWIDKCAAGIDHMSSSALVGVDLDLDCIADTRLSLSGPAWVRRSNPQDDSLFFPGLRPLEGHLDVLDTELVAMQLSGAGGVSLTAGAGYGAGGVLPPSLGAIAEQPGDAGLGDSQFFVFFEADLGGVLAYNHDPLEVKAKIDCVPPNTAYIHPTGCTPLFNSPFAGAGEQVANLVAAEHSTFPACGDPTTGDCFSPNETPFCEDAECCRSVCNAVPECCDVGWDVTCVEVALKLCPRTEACCFPTGECADDLPTTCRERGGVPQGPGSDCGSVQCEVLGACCDVDVCVGTMSEAACAESGGTSWHAGEDCANFVCQPPFVEHDFFELTTALVQLVGGPFGSTPRAFVLRGPAQVDVFFEPGEGDARDDDGNGRDDVETEIVAMSLTDGLVTLSLNPAQPSRGMIEELVNNNLGTLDVDPFAPGDANSFFDVFFQIDDGTFVFHNEQPLRIASVIDHKPPAGARYIHLVPPAGPVELFDADGNPTGVFIVRAEHDTGAVEIDEFPFSFGEVSLVHPDGTTEQISLTGTARVHVFFEGAVEGDADDDDGDGLDDVPTEMVALNLSGTSSQGPVVISLNPMMPSPGGLEETANNVPGTLDLPPFTTTGSANSFFDLFFQVQVAGQTWFTVDPKRMRAIIDHKPPGTTAVYENPDLIPLYDENGEPTGYLLGQARHQPNPPQACCLPEGGCAEMTRAECRARDGAPLGPNTECSGDANGNRIDDACEPNEPCDECGPGDHWVDRCPGGVDRIPSGALAGIDLNGDCEADTNMVLRGPLTVRRGSGSPHAFETEILSMSLTGPGATLRAGAGGGVGGILAPSLGQVVEQGATPGAADSFFDVFFEISADSLPGPLYNQTPLRMESKIDCVPPDAAYINVDQCLPLFASPIPEPGSKPVANLVRAQSTTYPTEACCLPDGTCAVMRPEHCRIRDGAPLGPNTECAGDNDGNRVDDACELNEPCDECGPGDHWVDRCPGGVDRIPSGALAGIDLNGDCEADTNIVLRGPLTIRRSGGSPHAFETEILSMSLTGPGATLRAGAGGGVGGILAPSLGQVVEQGATPSAADSFFDVFFEISADSLPGPLYNQTPLRMESKIDCVPPEAAYINVTQCLPLFASPIPGPGSKPVANLVRAESTTFPPLCPPDATIGKAVPRDGTVDARRPHPQGSPGQREGIGSPGGPSSKPEPIIVALTPYIAVPERCFALCETAEDPVLGPNSIARISYLGQGAYQILLDHAITAGAVTTIQYKGDGSSVAYTSHPTNVNGDGRADGHDLISWVECCLHRRCEPPWGIFSCDIDHSNRTDQLDVLEAVDWMRSGWLGTPRPGNDTCPER